MSLSTSVMIALAGGGGAVTRFVVDGALRARWPPRRPWPTILINVTGSLLLGVLTGLVLFHSQPSTLTAVAGTGFCGGYTTFSTASFESVRLLQQRAYLLAAVNTVATPLMSVTAASLGLLLTH